MGNTDIVVFHVFVIPPSTESAAYHEKYISIKFFTDGDDAARQGGRRRSPESRPGEITAQGVAGIYICVFVICVCEIFLCLGWKYLSTPSSIQVAQEELDTMAKLNSRLGYEIKRNELALTNMMKNYDGRKQFAQRLEQVNDYEMCWKVTQALPIILKNVGTTLGWLLLVS